MMLRIEKRTIPMKENKTLSSLQGIIVIALVISIFLVGCVGYTSNEEKLSEVKDSLQFYKELTDSLYSELTHLRNFPSFDSFLIQVQNEKRASRLGDETQIDIFLSVFNNGLNKSHPQTSIIVSAHLNSPSPYHDTIIISRADTRILYSPQDENDTVLNDF